MSDRNDKREKVAENPLRRLYDTYAAGVGYISTRNLNGDFGIGSCFHIGEGVLITARHVLENRTIVELGIGSLCLIETEKTATKGVYANRPPYKPESDPDEIIIGGPFYHPNLKVDVAALIIPGLKTSILPLGSHLDDWLDSQFLLSSAIALGYPRIPFASRPYLFVSKCEVNAIIDKYIGGHPHFIVSSTARGGFSGGPVISEWDFVLGVITESLVKDHDPVELGYFAVLSIEGIYTCLEHHRIVPKNVDEVWDGFWNKETIYFGKYSEQISVTIYRGNNEFYFEVYSYRPDIITNALEIFDTIIDDYYSLLWMHDERVKVDFKTGTIAEGKANNIYSLILGMIEALGIKRYDFENETPF